MPEATPHRQYVYPLPTDPNDLSYIMQVVLEQIDNDVAAILDRQEAETSFIGEVSFPTIAAGAALNVTVTYPDGLFSTPPLVVGTLSSGSYINAVVGARTTTSAVFTLRNLGTVAMAGSVTYYARTPSTPAQ